MEKNRVWKRLIPRLELTLNILITTLNAKNRLTPRCCHPPFGVAPQASKCSLCPHTYAFAELRWTQAFCSGQFRLQLQRHGLQRAGNRDVPLSDWQGAPHCRLTGIPASSHSQGQTLDIAPCPERIDSLLKSLSFTKVIWSWHEGHMKVARRSHEGHMKVTRRLHEGHRKVTWRSHEDHPKAIGRSHYFDVKVTWRRPCRSERAERTALTVVLP